MEEGTQKSGWKQQTKAGATGGKSGKSPAAGANKAAGGKPDALAKDEKTGGAARGAGGAPAGWPNATGAKGKLNQTSEGEDEKYTTEQNEDEEKYSSQNYTEDYSSLQNKSGIDFNKLNKKFEL